MNSQQAPRCLASRWGFAAAATAVALFGGGCERAPPPRAAAPPEVAVIEARQQDVPIAREWVGTLAGLVHAHVHPQVTGYLIARPYREGAAVKKGDLMFEVDPRPFQAALDQALARLGKDELDVQRLRPLAKLNAVSQQELDDALQADLGDKAAVEQARINLGFTRVTAPIDGIAGLAQAEIGDLVGPGTVELTTVSTLDPIKVYFTLSEADYLRYGRQLAPRDPPAGGAPPAPFELILADGARYPRQGAYYATDNQLDARTGALRVAALFPNPDHRLLPGQFARVRLTEVRSAAVVIPQRAVMELQDAHLVAVVDAAHQVHLRPVTVGERYGALWIIAQGLRAGEQVVVEGVQKVRDGARVQPRPFAAPPAVTNAPAAG